MYINREWKRGVAAGCLHSVFACPVALDNVIAIVEDYEPHVRLDLGDLHDLAAFRSGAPGTPDEAADLGADYDAGVSWLRRYRPTHRVLGNHDWRIHKMLAHPKAIIRFCAQAVIEKIADVDAENGTQVKPYHQRRGWWQFGDAIFGHGWMYNENALRDHAETYGKCVIAHLHYAHTARGRTRLETPAHCVGTLADPDKLDYAQTRRSTLRWNHGLVMFQYCEDECRVQLVQADCAHGGSEVWT